MAEIDHVEAFLNYLVDNSPKPVVYMYRPPEGVPAVIGEYASHTMSIFNARRVDQLSLDQQGFALTHQDSAVRKLL